MQWPRLLLFRLLLLSLTACGSIEVIQEPEVVVVQVTAVVTATPDASVAAMAVAETTDEGEIETPVSLLPIPYDFNVTSIADTQCWRVRTDIDGTKLGQQLLPAPDKGLNNTGALAFYFKLPPPIGLGAQVDQLVGGSECGHRLPRLPSTGQVQAWVYHATDETELVGLRAELFFAPIDMKTKRGGGITWLRGPAVPLQPNQWTYLCWDATNTPSGEGFGADDWLEGELQAFGLEVKYANPATRTSYEGVVYIDNMLITDEPLDSCAKFD